MNRKRQTTYQYVQESLRKDEHGLYVNAKDYEKISRFLKKKRQSGNNKLDN